jgi:hypothetical protein
MQLIDLNSEKKFGAFYTLPAVWVDVPVVFDESIMNSNYVFSRPALLKNMSEVVYSYNNDGFLIQVCRDGLVMFSDQVLAQTNDLFEKWRYILKALNVLYVLIDGVYYNENNNFAYFQYQLLRKKDIIIPTYSDDSFLGFTGPIHSYAYPQASSRTLRTFNSDDGFWNDDRIRDRMVVSLDTFNGAVSIFDAIYSAGLLNSAYLFSQAVAELKENQNEISLVHSWTILEKIINLRYSSHQSFLKKFINWLDHKGIWRIKASEKLRYLKLKENKKRYNEIHHILARRNSYLHGQSAISIKDASMALEVCCREFEAEYGIALKYSPIITANGI